MKFTEKISRIEYGLAIKFENGIDTYIDDIEVFKKFFAAFGGQKIIGKTIVFEGDGRGGPMREFYTIVE